MSAFNIYMAGVGGQGIGLLSEVLLRAADHAGQPVKSVDTHGLAQRGGIVVSQLRIGQPAYSPLIGAHDADLVIALERHEAMRAAESMLKQAGDAHLLRYRLAASPSAPRRSARDRHSTHREEVRDPASASFQNF